MYKNINIKMTNDKKLIILSSDIANKYDSNSTTLTVKIADEYNSISNHYIALQSPTGDVYVYPLIDNVFTITTNQTKITGNWKTLVFLTNILYNSIDDIKNAKSTDTVCVSNVLDLTIDDNFLSTSIINDKIDPNLTVLYDNMQAAITYINSSDFKNQIASIVESDIENKIIADTITQIKTSYDLDQIAKNKTDISTLSTTVSNHSTSINTLQTNVQTNSTNIQTNVTNISKNTTAISELTTTVNSISSTLVANNATLTAILGGAY